MRISDWSSDVCSSDLYRADGEGYLEPGFEKIFLVPATGGAPRQLTFGPYHDGGLLSWSRDGRTLYFAANRRADWESDPVESEVYALDVAGGGVTALTDRNGPEANPHASSDGGNNAYLGLGDNRTAHANKTTNDRKRAGK